MINKIINCIKKAKEYVKKKRILKLAASHGCDADGDILYYKHKPYFVHILNNIVVECKLE